MYVFSLTYRRQCRGKSLIIRIINENPLSINSSKCCILFIQLLKSTINLHRTTIGKVLGC